VQVSRFQRLHPNEKRKLTAKTPTQIAEKAVWGERKRDGVAQKKFYVKLKIKIQKNRIKLYGLYV
jgi:hypothetical protein